MKKRFEKGSKEWTMFVDFWNYCKKYWRPADSQTYWEDVMKAGTELYKTHPTPYAKHLILGFQYALEEIAKGAGDGKK